MVAERLYIKDIKGILPYRTTRTIKKWCRNNNVLILSDIGMRDQFVLKAQLEEAMERNHRIKSSSKRISQASWNKKLQKKMKDVLEYKPQGEYEKDFLSIFTNIQGSRYDALDG